MSTETLAPAVPLPDDGHYARNLIGGCWRFPAAPYEFEIRNPADSTITTTVPLSSRFDVAQAVAAADDAALGPWSEPPVRAELLAAFLDRLEAGHADLARLQSVETGLTYEDSQLTIGLTLATARALVQRAGSSGGGASGHILSWGLPFTEFLTSVLSALAGGGTVIVKPSLRGPLTPVALALLATEAGFPDGVVNLVQGIGVDVGADLMTRPGLSALYVRAGERTLAQAERSRARTTVPLHILRGGGNAMVIGPDADHDFTALADTITAAVRIHSAGGPFGLPLLAVHRDLAEPLMAAVMGRLSTTVAVPLPTEPLRRQALERIDTLTKAGAHVLLGGADLPDDITHRMGWRMPPTVVMLGPAGSPAVRAEQAGVPLGPVLSVFTWRGGRDLATAFTASRAAHGTATVRGLHGTRLPHGVVTAGSRSGLPKNEMLPAAWTGGAP